MNLEKTTRLPHDGRELLGKWIRWTEKRDGTCLAVWLKKPDSWLRRLLSKTHYNIMTSTRRMRTAQKDIRSRFFACDNKEHLAVLKFLKDNPNYIVFGELLQKGISPTRIEMHKKNEFLVFDIWDGTRLLTYTQVYQFCHHYGMKCVRLFGESRHASMESLWEFRDAMLELCRKEKREGVVLKAFYPDGTSIYSKEKIDTPRPKKMKVDKKTPVYPPLPDSEVFGAVDKVFADLGKKYFSDPSKAMPLIAQYVSEECKKHLCGKPLRKLFDYYVEYADGKGIKIGKGKKTKKKFKSKKKKVKKKKTNKDFWFWYWWNWRNWRGMFPW